VDWLTSALVLPIPEPIVASGLRRQGVQELLGPDPTTTCWALAKFMGHRSPSVTLAHYLLAIDWLVAQMMKIPPSVSGVCR
jgi:hypothetical protein